MRSKSRQLSLDKTGSLFGSRSGPWSFALNILARRSIIFLKLRSAVSVERSADNEGLPAFIEIRGRFLV
jgi:hypothetical protein